MLSKKVTLFHEDLVEQAVSFYSVLGNSVVCLDDIEFYLTIISLGEEKDLLATVCEGCLVHPCCHHRLNRHLLDHSE